MAEIWLADLAAYNAGNLVGEWVELGNGTDLEEIHATLSKILARGEAELKLSGEFSGPHEEFAIHDYSGFYGIRIGEYDSLDRVQEIACVLDDFGYEDDRLAFGEFLAEVSDLDEYDDIHEAVEAFRDRFVGRVTLREYAEEWHEDQVRELKSMVRNALYDERQVEAFERNLDSMASKVDLDRIADELSCDFTESGPFLFRDF